MMRAAILLPLLLTACAADDYPSLARRPEELATAPVATPAPSAPAAPLDPALAARLDALTKRAEAADHRLAAALPIARARIAAAAHAPLGSDAWSAANTALAGMEADRADLGIALGELDQLANDDRVANALIDAATDPSARPAGAAVAKAHDAVLALADAEDAALAPLRDRLAD